MSEPLSNRQESILRTAAITGDDDPNILKEPGENSMRTIPRNQSGMI